MPIFEAAQNLFLAGFERRKPAGQFILAGRLITNKALLALLALGMRNENLGRTEAYITVFVRCTISDCVNSSISAATSLSPEVNGAILRVGRQTCKIPQKHRNLLFYREISYCPCDSLPQPAIHRASGHDYSFRGGIAAPPSIISAGSAADPAPRLGDYHPSFKLGQSGFLSRRCISR